MYKYGCQWKITALAGRRTVVSIKDVNLSRYAGYETIVIDDHVVIDLQKLIINFRDYVSDGNKVFIQFYSYYWMSKRFLPTAAIYEEPGKTSVFYIFIQRFVKIYLYRKKKKLFLFLVGGWRSVEGGNSLSWCFKPSQLLDLTGYFHGSQ